MGAGSLSDHNESRFIRCPSWNLNQVDIPQGLCPSSHLRVHRRGPGLEEGIHCEACTNQDCRQTEARLSEICHAIWGDHDGYRARAEEPPRPGIGTSKRNRSSEAATLFVGILYTFMSGLRLPAAAKKKPQPPGASAIICQCTSNCNCPPSSLPRRRESTRAPGGPHPGQNQRRQTCQERQVEIRPPFG